MTRPAHRVVAWLAVLVLASIGLVSPPTHGRSSDAEDDSGRDSGRDAGRAIVVGSKNFTESRILAEILAQLIESRLGVTVERRTNLGGTMVIHAAIASGAIDLYPEYTGTGWATVLGQQSKTSDPLRTYLTVDRLYRERFELAWLEPFGFSNSYAVAVRETLAEELDLDRVSDLVPHADRLRAGWSHEFLDRMDGFPGLAAAYGLSLGEVRGMEHGLAYEAIREGLIDITDAYTTDGKLLRFDVRVLDDDRRYFPPYDCAPVARLDTLARYPRLEAALGELAFTLPATEMQRLNLAVEEDGRRFADVARSFLIDKGLLRPSATGGGTEAGDVAPLPSDAVGDAGDADAGAAESAWAFFAARRHEIARLVIEHLGLTAIAVLLAVIVAVPLGIVLTRWRALAGVVLTVTGVLQTVPSLALLAFMIPFLGLGAPAAIAALFLYALLPIVRNTYVGIRDVDAELREAALGMGLEGRQILTLVELPMAVPTIMAGIRTATVIAIGVATLGAFIGAGGLGVPILTGLQLNDSRLILSGAIPAALLAVLADLVLGWVERRLAPS